MTYFASVANFFLRYHFVYLELKDISIYIKEEQKLCNSKMNREYKGKEEIQIKNGIPSRNIIKETRYICKYK